MIVSIFSEIHYDLNNHILLHTSNILLIIFHYRLDKTREGNIDKEMSKKEGSVQMTCIDPDEDDLYMQMCSEEEVKVIPDEVLNSGEYIRVGSESSVTGQTDESSLSEISATTKTDSDMTAH